jgi:transposase
MQIRSVCIELGKTTVHLVALGASCKVLVKKKFTQKQLLAFTANMQTSLIGLAACSRAHFLGRALKQQGYDVRLIAAQFVKPFVKSNKNDFVDAEAIAEAVERKNMRFVPIKTDDQLDLQAIHRIRWQACFPAHSGHQPYTSVPVGARYGLRTEASQTEGCEWLVFSRTQTTH